MRVVISSGHGKYVRGASGYIDEVDQARIVVEDVATVLRQAGVEVTTYHDDVSKSQNENLNRIVDFHNSKTRDWDVSVHFNAYQTTSKPMGCEVLFVSSTGQTMAQKTVNAIVAASGLTNRGPKKRTDLFFLNNTEMPAILIEVCFVDSQADVDIYHRKLDVICEAIAESLAGREIDATPPPTEPPPQEVAGEEAIKAMAAKSAIAQYQWKDRGRAPLGYMQGFALTWAGVVQRFVDKEPAVIEMAKANTLDPDLDALAWYGTEYNKLGMSNATAGIDTLRHLYVLLLGLGMRESSGKHCVGRDTTASNVTHDTAEAGLFQTSYNAHTCTAHFDVIMEDYEDGRHEGYLEEFSAQVTCSASDWASFGQPTQMGYKFQELCKREPAFAVESCALVLRNRRQHYGPIVRREAELKQEADWLLLNIQRYVMAEGGEA